MLQIGSGTTELIVNTGYNFSLIEKLAQNYATALFTRLQKKSPESLIESVTVTYEALYLPKSWAFVVTLEVGGEGFVVEKRFEGMDFEPAINPMGTYYIPWG